MLRKEGRSAAPRKELGHDCSRKFRRQQLTGLLFYVRSAGVGEFYATDGSGNLNLLGSESGWRGSWDQMLPLRLGGGRTALLFYDRNAGTGEFYSTDGVDGIALLKTHTDWRTTWKKIVPLKLDNSNRTYLFFYEQETGYADVLRRCSRESYFCPFLPESRVYAHCNIHIYPSVSPFASLAVRAPLDSLRPRRRKRP
jgi:hypothetical protein